MHISFPLFEGACPSRALLSEQLGWLARLKTPQSTDKAQSSKWKTQFIIDDEMPAASPQAASLP
jgi:hypothetical protein